ncbi:hypothetical protein VP01_907g8 [Puccinia sorghi]|uniref:Uncharacterized protein n=1 Tax=Puccinia sorghi TaxID=27349 RepID=A0A0L6U9T1_9BASI|nr:hypothetical protein VP01_907g8 [Puccinia sorghi]
MADAIKLHRRHGFYVLVMVIGCYLQNIRNNENRKRTPKWATKAGLVKDKSAKRKARTQWANRYDERTPTRADGYQDDDEHPNGRTETPREQGLLEPESFMDSSSINTREDRSIESGPSGVHRQRAASDISQEARDLERSAGEERHHLRKKLSHRHTRPSVELDTSQDAHNNSKISRRKTSQSFRHQAREEDDPYFIRRASSIHVPTPASHSKIGSLGSPTSVKSFSQKFGFGSSKKTEKKNRFDVTNEARSQWENLSKRHSAHSANRPDGVTEDDGLNHQF